MAGYSGTPLPKKLGIPIKGHLLAINAPEHFRSLLDPWPDGATYSTAPHGQFGVIVTFEMDADQLATRFRDLIPLLEDRGALWFAWPKKASKIYVPGLTEDTIRDIGLAAGLVDVKVCAIDEDWSGLKFVRRLK